MALTSITKDFVVKSGIVVRGTSAVTTTSGIVGALEVAGGAGIAKNLIVGTTATIFGPAALQSTLDVAGNSTVGGNLNVTGLFTATGATTLGSTLGVTGAATLSSTLGVTGNATFSADAQVAGLFTATGATTLGSTLGVAGAATLSSTLGVTGDATFSANAKVAGLFTATGATTLGNTLDVAGVTKITSSVGADTNTGALVVTGGTYIGEKLIVASAASSVNTTASNSIYTAGGVGVEKDIRVGGDVVITGNLSVLGTQVIVNSTVTSISDPTIDIGTGPNGDPAVNDGYNKGMVLHYWSTEGTPGETHMFLGRQNSNGHLVLRTSISEAHSTLTNALLVTGGVYGTMDLGTLIVHDTTNSTNTTTGALQVAGGVGIGGDVNIGGTLTVATLVSTGGSVDASVTTATNLAGGALGLIPIQSASGQTAFIPAGTVDKQVLTWNQAGTTATWQSASGTTVGTASNLEGGAQWQIPFQTGVGATGFDAAFTYNSDTNTLYVDNAVISNDVTVNDLTVTGTLGVTSATTLSSTLGVAGDATFSANSQVAGLFTASGATTLGSTLGVTGAATLSSTLGVTGNATFSANAQVAGLFTASGATTLGSTLGVTGAATLSSTLQVNNTDPTLAGAQNGSVYTQGGAKIAKDLYVGTTATIGGDMYIAGQIYMQGAGLSTITASTGTFDYVVIEGTGTGLTVVDDASVGGDLTVTGTLNAANIQINAATLDHLAITTTTNASSLASKALDGTEALGVAGGVKIIKDAVVGGVVYAGKNKAGTGGASPAGQVIDGVFIANSMQSGGTYTGVNAATTIDTWSKLLYTTAKYIVQVTNGTDIHSVEMLVIQNGTSVYISQYGIVTTNAELGEFDGAISGNDVVISFTPAAGSVTVQVVRQSILTSVDAVA